MYCERVSQDAYILRQQNRYPNVVDQTNNPRAEATCVARTDKEHDLANIRPMT